MIDTAHFHSIHQFRLSYHAFHFDSS